MALRTIVQDGDPILKKKCRPVTKFDDRLGELLDDMKETLTQAEGYGLAGPQVGILRRLFITVDERDVTEEEMSAPDYTPKYLECINPEIIATEGEELGYEGCLSFPGRNAAVRRPTKATIRAFDRYGKPFTATGEGILARCFCHETDHLNGVTILDLAEFFYEDQNEDDAAEE